MRRVAANKLNGATTNLGGFRNRQACGRSGEEHAERDASGCAPSRQGCHPVRHPGTWSRAGAPCVLSPHNLCVWAFSRSQLFVAQNLLPSEPPRAWEERGRRRPGQRSRVLADPIAPKRSLHLDPYRSLSILIEARHLSAVLARGKERNRRQRAGVCCSLEEATGAV